MSIQPKSYSTSCTSRMLQVTTKNNSWDDDTSDAIKDTFEESNNYRLVYKNMNYNTPYKTWIYEGNMSEKTAGYLHLLSYPYNSVMFSIGDYIQFNYDHTNLSPSTYKYWLIQALDNRHLYNVHGRIIPCNQELRWLNSSSVVKSYPCYFNIEMTKTSILDSSQGFDVESGGLIAIVQNNSDTQTIYVNQRFILNGRTFICYQYNDAIDYGLIYIYLRITPGLDEDDYDNEIAYNGKEIPKEEELDGDVLNIDSTTLSQGSTIDINIYHYTDNVKDNDTYTLTTSDVPVTKYTTQIVDGNNFKLTNNEYYLKNALKLEFENNTTHNKKYLYIWLGGSL